MRELSATAVEVGMEDMLVTMFVSRYVVAFMGSGLQLVLCCENKLVVQSPLRLFDIRFWSFCLTMTSSASVDFDM